MVADARAPIGVFDSGIGGLTVARELMRQLPGESIIYFGDTARVPYGPKSPDTVLRYSREITTYLRERGVKAVVVACNTATAHALPELRAEQPIPVIGVVEPGARAAVTATRRGQIGVIPFGASSPRSERMRRVSAAVCSALSMSATSGPSTSAINGLSSG